MKFKIVFRDGARDDVFVDGDYLSSDAEKVQVMRKATGTSLRGPAAAMGIGDKAVFVAPLNEIAFAVEEPSS